MESLLANYSKSNNFYLNHRSDWCVQLRFEFVYPYHAHHKTAAPEPLTIPTTDWKSFNDDKLANYRLLNSFKKINAKKSSKKPSIIFNNITASLQKIVGTLWNGAGTFSKIPVIRQKSKAFDSEKVGAHRYHLHYNLSVRSIFWKNVPSRVFFSCTLSDQKKKNNITLSKKCTITSQILPYMYLLNAVSDWLTDRVRDWLTDWLTC